MHTLVLATMLAANLGPMGPDAPARQPQMAANGSMVALTFGAGKGIYFSASYDAGKTFSAPVKVAEAERLALGRHRGPRVAMSGRATVISAVTHGPSDGDLIVWRSTDGGKAWSKGIAINDVPGAAREGLQALAADAKGNFFAAWLDLRGDSGTKLYGSRSTDGGVTWSKNTLVYQSPDGTICQCCHPSVAIDADGQVLAMWRNWLGGSRDMYLARSRDGATFAKAEKLGAGTWQLNACPMDGGGVAVAGGRTVTAWRRGEDIFLAEPGKPEMQIGKGKDVAVALNRDRVFAIWSSGAKIESWSNGEMELLASAGSFPTITALPMGGALAAWEEGGAIVTRSLPQTALRSQRR